MPYIETAYRGRVKMLSAIFGGGDAAPAPEKPKMTPKLFASMFGGKG